MTDALYLRLKSLNTRTVRGVTSPKNIVRVAAMHNLREIQAELGASATSGINPGRMHLNYQLRGPDTADGVAALAQALLDNAGVAKLRRDACMCVELVVSLPAATTVDHSEYFAGAVAWADAYFNVPMLSAAVHLDEAAPHCHILLLPLVAGRMQGGALAGGPAKIRAMLADFQQQMARRFGITHQPRAKRLSKPNRDAAGRMVLDALRARPERLREPAMRDALITALGSQAEALLALLGLGMPATKAKARSFVDLMTAPCKPERTYRTAPNAKHIDIAQNFGSKEDEKFDNIYLCVDVAPSADPFPVNDQRQPATDNALISEQVSTPASGFQTVASAHHQGAGKSSDTPQAIGSRGLPVASKSEPGKPRFDAGTLQATETLHSSELAPACVPSGQWAEFPAHCGSPSARANTGKSRNYGNNSQLDEIYRPACPAPLSPTSTAPAVSDDDTRNFAHASPDESGQLKASGTDGDYQRQRDDDRPAEHWNADTGEFVSTTSAPARPPGRHGRTPYSARASPAGITRALLALAGTTEPKTPVRAESEP